ncbi:RidA family protein [Streptomyces sp. NPDC093252]|uniref:RidA family protein n=1 Tax=Streptomyces sp. NPDC093252 TaxID=3154980 RepID=UPI00342E313F
MSHTVINPAGLHNPVEYGYSHLVDAPSPGIVLVAGQYASDTEGHVMSADFAQQVERSFENLATALAAVGLDTSHVVRLGTYIVGHEPGRLDTLLAVIKRIWGDAPPTQTLLGVAALALPDMLFEVDAIAVRP